MDLINIPATAGKIVEIAKSQLGVKENPPNSNNVKYNTWYYGKPVRGSAYPWCMTFVQWVFHEAGGSIYRTASCNALINFYRPKGLYVRGGYQPGDVLMFDFKGKGITHTGICVSASKTQITSIEGNTSIASDDNGGTVMLRNRSLGVVAGAVRFKFEQEDDDDMTGEQIYTALSEYLKTQQAPNWAKTELQQAMDMGITDGSNPCGLIPRYQAALMAKRAVEAALKRKDG